MGEYRYLIKVEPDANNNKFYKMIQNGDSFEVQYGRVGNGGHQTYSYGMNQWDKKLKAKLKKGYVDKTELVAEIKIKPTDKENVFSKIANFSIKSIVDKLQSYANKSIKANYTVSASNVTQKMIDSADEQINKLLDIDDLEIFNKSLVDLFMIIPRKMENVSSHLARSKDDFGDIINKERDVLDVMRGQIVTEIKSAIKEYVVETENILQHIGVEFEEVTPEEIREIKKLMGGISNNFDSAWKVKNLKTQENFENFVKEENIKTRKMLFHGTRSENVWNILKTGLVLRPQAKINGKMFGEGIYYAPKARKSLGYTSLGGSYWAGGNSNEGYMLLFDVAYGVPYDAYKFDSKYYNLNYSNLQRFKAGANCLHAHSGTGMLRNDEIIVYKEEQSTVKYLIQLKKG